MLRGQASGLLYDRLPILFDVEVVAYEVWIYAWHLVGSPGEYFNVLFEELEHLLTLGLAEGRAEQKEEGTVLVYWHSNKVFDCFLFGGLADVFEYLKVGNFDPLDLLRCSGIMDS